MRPRLAIQLVAVVLLATIGGCDRLATPRSASGPKDDADTALLDAFLSAGYREEYLKCLAAAAAGSSPLLLADIRTLCAEASGVSDLKYHYDPATKGVLPSDEFTRCYDKEKKDLESKGVTTATRLAKLSCKYSDVE